MVIKIGDGEATVNSQCCFIIFEIGTVPPSYQTATTSTPWTCRRRKRQVSCTSEKYFPVLGFHLSASVQQNYRGTQYVSVAVTFDRRRISSCNCTCDSTAYWCSHIVAVCLTRIHSVSLSRGGKVGRGVSAATTAVRPSTCTSVSCVSITSTSPASVQPLPLCVYNGETRLCLPTSERRSHREE